MKEIEQIKIKLAGKEYTCALGLGFLGSFLQEESIKMNEFDAKIEANPVYYLPKIIFHSIKFHCELEEEKTPAFKEVFKNFHIEGFMSDEVNNFQQALKNSMITNLPKDEGKGKAKK